MESASELHWLASSDTGTESLIGGEGTDIRIGVPGRDYLIGGIV